MAEKSDEEIINEVGLEASNDITDEEALAELSIRDENEPLEPVNKETSLNQNSESEEEKDFIENEDRDDVSESTNDKSSDKEINNKDFPIQKKQSKIFKILIGIAALLFTILIVGFILYLSGLFDPEPVKLPPKKTIEKKALPEVMYDEQDINKQKLNKKLTMLTKKEIMDKEELEAEEKRIKAEEKKKKEEEQKAIEEKKKKEEEHLRKIKEEEKALKEQQDKLKAEQKALLDMQEKLKADFEEQKKKLLEELQKQKMQVEEDPIENEEVASEKIETPINEEEIIQKSKEEDIKEENIKQFLSFINVATIKGELYKSYLDKVMTFNKDVSLCRDSKNRIEIYFGPFDSNKEREKVLNNLLKNGFEYSYLVDFTQEEYQKRCKY